MLQIEPSNGLAYLGLSDLRANLLNEDDVARMIHTWTTGIPDLSSRRYMAYALAHTLERMKEYEGAFEAYAFSAKTSKQEVENTEHAHDPANFEERLARGRKTFTEKVMSARMEDPPPTPATTPIFVLGMPRAGSTLVEQILATTLRLRARASCLPWVGGKAHRREPPAHQARYVSGARARLQPRRTARTGRGCSPPHCTVPAHQLPYVVDKRPWNWIDIPFLALALPQAEIHRHPARADGCRFCHVQADAALTDAAFIYDLVHIGRYYRAYVAQMEYFEDHHARPRAACPL